MTRTTQQPTTTATSKPVQPSSAPGERKPVTTTGDEMVCTLCGLRACWTE